MALDMNDADDVAAIEKIVNDKVAGLKTNNQKLIDEKRKAQEALEKYADIDPEKYKKVMSAFNQNEEAKLISEGKINDVIEMRTQKAKAASDAQLSAIQQKLVDAETAAKSANEKYTNSVLDNKLIEQAVSGGVEKSAIIDVISRSKGIFSLDESGNIVAKDKDGNVVYNDDGNPYSQKDFVMDLRKSAPHFFGRNEVGALRGVSQDASSDYEDHMTKMQKAAASGNRKEYEKLLKQLE